MRSPLGIPRRVRVRRDRDAYSPRRVRRGVTRIAVGALAALAVVSVAMGGRLEDDVLNCPVFPEEVFCGPVAPWDVYRRVTLTGEKHLGAP